MKSNRDDALPTDLDGLRLLGLGRIPRCARCSRYRVLNTEPPGTPLPDVPSFCSYQVCAPLAARHEEAPRPRLVVAKGA